MSDLVVRWMRRDDLPAFVDYWFSSSTADLERMAVDVPRLPPRDEMYAALLNDLGKPNENSSAAYLIWEIDGKAIGFSSFKDIVRREIGHMHLHMWDASSRGHGHGAALFCRSALLFYETLLVRSIVCEPSVANPMPNRMLQKIGFPLIRTYRGRSSSLSAETELNRYEILRDVAAKYVAGCQPVRFAD